MGYLGNATRFESVTVNGVNFSSHFVSFTCSDASANKNGLISTTGDLVFGNYGEMPSMEDYDRNAFKRGHQVVINISSPGLGTVRHPRGLLYVISTAYEPGNDELLVQVGCKLALAALTEDTSEFIGLAPVPLDPAQRTYSNVSASFAAAGKYLFQNNQGTLVQGDFFSGDSFAGSALGEWVSVYGTTTLAASPLAAGSAIPDQIEVSYQVPSDALASNQSGKIEITETESRYFLQYPATLFIRKPPEIPENEPREPQPPAPRPKPPSRTSGCGNSPIPPSTDLPSSGPSDSPTPGGSLIDSCSEDYETKQQTTYVPVTKTSLSRSTYSGPSAQLSDTYSETYGPAMEVNQQYYADKIAYCRSLSATSCNPNGGCKMEGLNNVKQSYSTVKNYYGFAGELIKTVTDNYATRLSGAIPSDYRSGEIGGENVQWRTISPYGMYRVSRQMVEYRYDKNSTTQDTYTWNSSTTRGSGIGGNIDALAGIKTHERRISTTVTANPIRPDTVNTVTTSTTERVSGIVLSSNYITPPNAAGPYVVKESLPVPVLFNNESQITDTVNAYLYYLRGFVLGDAYGISVAETLRDDIVSNWRPGMPFRFYDPRNGKISALRMDACSWGLDASEGVVATSGIWGGFSNGTITVPSNLSGNSRPDMGGGGTPPVGPGGDISVNNETVVDSGSYYWDVNIEIMTAVIKDFWGDNGILPITPTDLVAEPGATLTVWCAGFIVGPGDLLDTEGDGGIPIEFSGSLVTAGATVIDADLFAP